MSCGWLADRAPKTSWGEIMQFQPASPLVRPPYSRLIRKCILKRRKQHLLCLFTFCFCCSYNALEWEVYGLIFLKKTCKCCGQYRYTGNYLMSLFFTMMRQTKEFPVMFTITSNDCTVVTAISAGPCSL